MKRLIIVASAMVLVGSTLEACGSGSGGTGGHAAACDAGNAGGASGSGGAGPQDAGNDAKPGTGGAGGAGGAGGTGGAGPADAGNDGRAADASMSDGAGGDAGPQPVVLNLCGTFDAMWPDGLPRNSGNSWPTVFIQGPAGTTPSEGYQNLVQADCAVEDLITSVPVADYSPWLTQLELFEYQLFGCLDPSVDAGSIGFALVPPNLYGQPLTVADLDRLSDWYLEAVIQAVIDRAVTQEPLPLDASFAPGLLTADQIEDIRQALAQAQAGYPNIVASTAFSDPMCFAGDAGTDAGDAGKDGG
jgi:hypothetical protein